MSLERPENKRACPKCGADDFESPYAYGGHVRTCDPALDRRIAGEYLDRIDEPGIVKRLAREHGLSPEGIRRAIKRTGVELRPSGGNVRARSIYSVRLPEAVESYADRFAYAGRCGECLTPGAHGIEHECERVRLTA